MPKKVATLDSLPKGYRQTVTKSGDKTVVIRLTRDYDSKGKRIARTYILSSDGNTLQYAGYFTPSKRDTHAIFETRQNPSAEGRNKAIRKIASKATPSSPSKPVKLDAPAPRTRKSKSRTQTATEAPSVPVEALTPEPEYPSASEPEIPSTGPQGQLTKEEEDDLWKHMEESSYGAYVDDFTEEEWNEILTGEIAPVSISDSEAWEMIEPQEAEWSHEALSELYYADPMNHNANKINWLFLGFSDLIARGLLDGNTQAHDSLILRASRANPDILSMDDVNAIQEYARRFTADEFNDIWDRVLDRLGMTNEKVFKYQPSDIDNAFETDAIFYYNLLREMREWYENKLDDTYPDERFHITEEHR